MSHHATFYKLKGWEFNPKYSTTLHKRHGSKWSTKEDNDLINLLLQEKTLEEISQIHHRSNNSILTRLRKLRWSNGCYKQINNFLNYNLINMYRRKKDV